MKRNIYLDMKPPQEARELFLERLNTADALASEVVPVTESLGRITAEPVIARLSCPHFHAAAMDGYAIKAVDSFGAAPEKPRRFRVGDNAQAVNTGHSLPAGTDAVVMIENVNFVDDESFEIESALVPWQHVRRVGEDFVASEMILPGRRRINPYDQGAMLAAGVTEVRVYEKPRVTIIPTGDELIAPDTLREKTPPPGHAIEFNSVMLSGIVDRAGGIARTTDIVPDNLEIVTKALADAVDSDAHMVVINAGSSAGSEDYTAAAIGELGDVFIHGVAMMPGKPTILGAIKGKPVIGNPGYPVSAVFSFEMFGLPVLEAMLGLPGRERPLVQAVAARKIPSKLGREEFLRVRLGRVASTIVATPLPRGAGSITTLTRAEGIARVSADSEGIDEGTEITVEALREPEEIEQTVVLIGSHDLTLDILADELRKRSVFLSSGHVGSLGGLLALKKGVCHLAASHLLDVNTGAYNWSYIDRYLPEIPVRVFNAVMREQGFIVPKGNPKGINGFQDLCRDDVRFVNRQVGAGTRVLLDYHLDEEGISSDDIAGYELEEYTHTSVAVAVLSGVADVGMGVLAAARALDLDFVPITTEQYDLVIPEAHMNDPKITAVLDVLRSDVFRSRVQDLGGYGTENTGREIPKPSA